MHLFEYGTTTSLFLGYWRSLLGDLLSNEVIIVSIPSYLVVSLVCTQLETKYTYMIDLFTHKIYKTKRATKECRKIWDFRKFSESLSPSFSLYADWLRSYTIYHKFIPFSWRCMVCMCKQENIHLSIYPR